MQEYSPFEQQDFSKPKPQRSRRAKTAETDLATAVPSVEKSKPKTGRETVHPEIKNVESAAMNVMASIDDRSLNEKIYQTKWNNLRELEQQLDELPWYRFAEHKRLLLQIENRKRELEKAKQVLVHERMQLPLKNVAGLAAYQELPDDSIEPLNATEVYQEKRLELGRIQKERKALSILPWKDRERKKALDKRIHQLFDELNRLKKDVKEEAERKQFME